MTTEHRPISNPAAERAFTINGSLSEINIFPRSPIGTVKTVTTLPDGTTRIEAMIHRHEPSTCPHDAVAVYKSGQSICAQCGSELPR